MSVQNTSDRPEKIHWKSICAGMLLFGIMATTSGNLQAQPSPDRIFDFMDRNKDGLLTEDETSRMPGNAQEMFRSNGLDLRRGVTKDQYIQVAPKMMEQMQRDRDRGGGDRGGYGGDRGSRGGYGGDRNSGDRGGWDRGNNGQSSFNGNSTPPTTPKTVSIWTPIKHDAVTVSMPAAYVAVDSDKDGQIGLYEWRATNKGSTAQFDALDIDQDGFLTAREMIINETKLKTTVPVMASNPQPNATATNNPSAPQTPVTTSTTTGSSGGENASKEERKEMKQALKQDAGNSDAAYIFGLLDKNKDGNVTIEEWAISKKLKPKFEALGLDLNQPMSQADFVIHYAKIGDWKK